ncbi:MAG: hypothetical protein ACPIOQ_25915, partial [Promethearchaeia archaeon]
MVQPPLCSSRNFIGQVSATATATPASHAKEGRRLGEGARWRGQAHHVGTRGELRGHTPNMSGPGVGRTKRQMNSLLAATPGKVWRGRVDASRVDPAESIEAPARPRTILLQALRGRRHLRAQAAKEPVQGVRRGVHLRAQADKEEVRVEGRAS